MATDNADRAGSRPLSVLLLGAETMAARPGGLNRYMADLKRALTREGTQVQGVVVGAEPSALGLTSVSDPSAGLMKRLLRYRSAASRALGDTDVVDAHFALYALLPIFSTWLRRRPLVVHFQGPWADESAVARAQWEPVVWLKRAIERAVYRRAEIVIVLSERFGELVVQRYGVEPSRVVVVPPGVDLDRFHVGDRITARRTLDIPETAFLCVAVRRLDARMGLDVLLDAWRLVQTEHQEAVLLVAGDGRERKRLETLRGQLPDPSRVRFLGRIDDDQLVTLYQAADISVVPTRTLEGFGLVTLESLACGTPPIVTDVGGLPDGVRGLDPSLVVRPDHPEALTARILDAARGAVPGRDACRAHAEGFAWDLVARRHMELYGQAAGARPMRIAYVGHTAELSGGELALARTVAALDDIDAHVILAEDGPLVERLRCSGANVEVVPMPERTRSLRRNKMVPRRLPIEALFDTAAHTLRLARRLRQLRPDVVHTNTLKSALYGGIAGRIAGVPVVWHVRDRIAPDYLPRPAVMLVRVASSLLPAMVVANSEGTLATLGRWPRRATVVASPVDPPGAASHDARGESPRPFTVGMVGRLAPWKGQDVFLRAFASAFQDGDERALVVGSAMFGEADWADSLRDLAASLGVAERVEFTGFIPDVTKTCQRMDVLVHASTIPEPFGQVVVEGMAAGLPVVASDAGGPAEIITDQVDGLLYAMGDVEALARHLRLLADDGELRARLANAAVVRAADFSSSKVAGQLMCAYSTVCAVGSPQ